MPRPLSLSWPLYDWPAHFVCYELVDGGGANGDVGDADGRETTAMGNAGSKPNGGGAHGGDGHSGGSNGSGKGDGQKHSTSRKHYLFDTMVYSRRSDNHSAIEANLAPRYEQLAPAAAVDVTDGGGAAGGGASGGGGDADGADAASWRLITDPQLTP